jgi:membrane protease YdiL (CAAX protease family)
VKEEKLMRARLKPAPILKMSGVMVTVALLIVLIYVAFRLLPDSDLIMRDSPWILAGLVHAPQFLVPLALIYWLSRGQPREYGFNTRQKPPVFTHARMLGLGALVGLLMSARHIPALLGNSPLDIPRPVTWANVLGHLSFQWIVVGVAEETMFRGLIQTYLTKTLEGHVKILGHDLHIGTVIGAVFWGVFHFINALIMPLGSVVFTVALTTLAGLAMGYAYQETGSLLTTIIVHNTIFGVPLTLGYLLHWLL